MIKINENFLKLQDSYLFSTINKKVEEYILKNPKADIIKMGIGDVTRPIPKAVITAIKNATDEMGSIETFRGYGPEQGYLFLREKIVENEYNGLNVDVGEIFVSDGAKCDTGNIVELFDTNAKIAAFTSKCFSFDNNFFNIKYANIIIKAYITIFRPKPAHFEKLPTEKLIAILNNK